MEEADKIGLGAVSGRQEKEATHGEGEDQEGNIEVIARRRNGRAIPFTEGFYMAYISVPNDERDDIIEKFLKFPAAPKLF